MKTLKSNLKLQGQGLMFAAPVELEIKPSDNKGIRFHINDAIIEACTDNVISSDHCVIVGDVQGKNKIALIEHFMAACAVCGIDALDVYFSSVGFEMPIFDGSAKVWVDEFNKVGFFDESAEVKKLAEPIVFQKDNSSIFIVPSDKTTITYLVNYDHKDLNNRWVSFSMDSNKDEIIEARTFGFLKDLEKFQALGYSKGVTIDNTLGLTDEGYTAELRSQYEPNKHKILDIIGDLYLTGYNPLKINANIIVKEAGHSYHIEAAKLLKNSLDK